MQDLCHYLLVRGHQFFSTYHLISIQRYSFLASLLDSQTTLVIVISLEGRYLLDVDDGLKVRMVEPLGSFLFTACINFHGIFLVHLQTNVVIMIILNFYLLDLSIDDSWSLHDR